MRNEADRYLEQSLKHHRDLLDVLFVYDDQSTDDSVEIAKQYADVVVVRDGGPSFIEHEGQFRYKAWKEFERVCRPRDVKDWVLAFDADEFLLARHSAMTTQEALADSLSAAEFKGATSVTLAVPEIFSYSTGKPMVRTDGLWGTIAGTRLFRYRTRGHWSDKAMGCGSEPHYVAQGPTYRSPNLVLMHFGYATFEDQTAKYDRYSKLPDHGHNKAHIESILQAPMLSSWTGHDPLKGQK